MGLIYYKNGASFPTTILPKGKFPLDGRCVVERTEDLSPGIWEKIFIDENGYDIWYEGMIVTAIDTFKTYVLIKNKVLESETKSKSELYKFKQIGGTIEQCENINELEDLAKDESNIGVIVLNKTDSRLYIITNQNEYSEINTGAGAVHFIGVSSTDPKSGIITIDGNIITNFQPGNIVIYTTKEYVYQEFKKEGLINGKWIEIGDENYEFADKTEITKDIIIKGGPFESVMKQVYPNGKIPKGENIQNIFTKLLFKEIWPSPNFGYTNHSFSANLSAISAVSSFPTSAEAGSNVSIGKVTGNNISRANSTYRSFYGFNSYATSIDGDIIPNNPPSVSGETISTPKGTYTLSRTSSGFSNDKDLNITVTNTDGSYCTIEGVSNLVVPDGTATISYIFKYEGSGWTDKIKSQIVKYYYPSNIGTLDEDHVYSKSIPEYFTSSPSSSIVTKTVSYSVTGIRYAFYGTTTNIPEKVDSNMIRKLTKTTNFNNFSMSINDGTKRVYLCCPKSWNKTLISVLDKKASNTNIASAFKLSEVSVEGNNKYNPITYTVWTYSPKTILGSNTYTIIFK